MKAAGTISIVAAILFFIIAASTIYQNTASLDAERAQASQEISGESASYPEISNNWGTYCAGEGVLGLVFLVAGIALVNVKQP